MSIQKEEKMSGQTWVIFTIGENPCMKIKDAYKLREGKTIMAELEYLHTLQGYKEMQASGYTRTIRSEYNEWKAHNFLYRIGFMRKQTKDCDIDQNEPKWRKVIYAILSIF